MSGTYEIIQYVAANGVAPVVEWLASLSDLNARSKVLIRTKRAEIGNLGKHRSVGGGVIELIIDWGPGYRVYCARPCRGQLLLLAGGSKGTQPRDIRLAKARWSDFKERAASRTTR